MWCTVCLRYLTVKYVLWCGFLEFDVPHQGDAVWFMGSIFIVVIGGDQQLGILRDNRKEQGEEETSPNTLNSLSLKTSKFDTCTCRVLDPI